MSPMTRELTKFGSLFTAPESSAWNLSLSAGNVVGVWFSRLVLAAKLGQRSGNAYPIVGLADRYDVVVNFLGL
jgi:hypothetical protein